MAITLKSFFASFFNNTDGPCTSWPSESQDYECGKSDFPLADAEIVRGQLYHFNVHKSMGPDEIHPRVPKEPVHVMGAPLLIMCQRSWQFGKVPANWTLANVILIYKKCVKEDPRNYKPLSSTSVTGKIMKIILGTAERHLKNNAIVRHSQHRFTKVKSYFN